MNQPNPTQNVKGLLLDPFKAAIVDVLVPRASVTHPRWHWLLDAEMVECVHWLAPRPYGAHAVFVDEAGYLREPHNYPQFKLAGANSEQPMAGYGIVTGLTPDGQNISDIRIPGPELNRLVQFEEWQKRLKVDDYLNQLMRLYLPWP